MWVAAQAAGVHRSRHYDWLKKDPAYVSAFVAAQDEAVQALEDEAVRRAYEGVEKPVTVAGQREFVREYSDTLLIFLLKGARPQKYRDNFNMSGGVQVDLGARLTAALQPTREKR
jgi:hypothetical protein